MNYNKQLDAFGISENIISVKPFGSGHINDTLCVTVKEQGQKKQYVLQKMNTDIFKDPESLMNNVNKVTAYMRNVIMQHCGDPARETLRFYPTVDGKMFYTAEDGSCWRLEDLVTNSRSYDEATNAEMFALTGKAFGGFMAGLANFPVEELVEVIPDFHNTKARFQAFKEFVKEDRAGRVESCKADVEFALARQELAESIVKQLESGELPLRVTHNDTKINNILMDADTDEPLCIIDLDTIMPGACAYDFGDSIRFGASSAAEDEQDLDKVYLRMDLFEAYVKGYLEAVAQTVTPVEVRSLAQGALVITYEQGIRFLGDHLNGDVYFKIHRENQNLDRARTQFKLVKEMEERMDEMQAIVDKYYKLANVSMLN